MSEEINHHRRRFLGTAAMTFVAAQFGIIGFSNAQFSKAAAAIRLPNEGDMPSLGGATEWLNSQPLTAAGLRSEKYKSQGLVVIGVNSPELNLRRTSTMSAGPRRT
jgi:hypothetical protein